jgi:hypothetical protein
MANSHCWSAGIFGEACRVMAKRLRDVCTLPESECSGALVAASSSATCRPNGTIRQ